jgi:hypothetical protein
MGWCSQSFYDEIEAKERREKELLRVAEEGWGAWMCGEVIGDNPWPEEDEKRHWAWMEGFAFGMFNSAKPA